MDKMLMFFGKVDKKFLNKELTEWVTSQSGVYIPVYVVNELAPGIMACARYGKIFIIKKFMETMDPQSIKAVLSHEIGHIVNKDSDMMMVFNIVLTLISITIGILTYKRYRSWTIATITSNIIPSPFIFVLGFMSKRMEYRADQYAKSIGYGVELTNLLRGEGILKWFSRWLYPDFADRIRRLEGQ